MKIKGEQTHADAKSENKYPIAQIMAGHWCQAGKPHDGGSSCIGVIICIMFMKSVLAILMMPMLLVI